MPITQSDTGEGKGRLAVSLVLFFLLGFLAVILSGVIGEYRGVRVEWLMILVVYLGIYKSPGLSVFLTLLLGVILDMSSASFFGEGLVSTIWVMLIARGVSRLIYADRPVMQFLILAACVMSLGGVLCFLYGIMDVSCGASARIFTRLLFSSGVTAFVGVGLLALLKRIDPERGGYYLTRFMPERREAPLI
ncbi:MAG: rod shape-determining protein MreD [Deltaproteobacteria bacterium]|nr:rod shape-determining protein MreD [Candidatus Zymogenaceae bacterium]